MDTQNLLSSLSSHSTIPSIILRPQNRFFAPSSSPSIQLRNWVSLETLSRRELLRSSQTFRRLKCESGVEQANSSVVKQGSKSGVKPKKLSVFVSGGGSNFRAIYDACVQGAVNGDVVVLVTSKEGCGGAEFARGNGIPVVLFPKTKGEPDSLSPDVLVNVLRRYEVDFILLAGYLKMIPVELIQAYPKSIINIHPSLLPAFGGKGYYGMKVHKAVVASGARYSGPTIHIVDEHYDSGKILAQRVVPVMANDTAEELAARVLVEEHSLYVEVTAALCEDRIVWREDGVPLIQSKENPDQFF